jgi:hypothetical protein
MESRDLVGVSWCIGVSVAGGLGGYLVGEFRGFWEDGVSGWWVGIGVSECGGVLKFKLKLGSEMKKGTWDGATLERDKGVGRVSLAGKNPSSNTTCRDT